MKGHKKRGIGLSYAFAGLKTVWWTERNFRIHLIAMVIVISLGVILQVNQLEWFMLILVIGFVLVAEMFNSAIERIINYIKPDIHPEAKKIKDIAAGAVLITAIVSILVGCMIFIPKIFKFIIE